MYLNRLGSKFGTRRCVQCSVVTYLYRFVAVCTLGGQVFSEHSPNRSFFFTVRGLFFFFLRKIRFTYTRGPTLNSTSKWRLYYRSFNSENFDYPFPAAFLGNRVVTKLRSNKTPELTYRSLKTDSIQADTVCSFTRSRNTHNNNCYNTRYL